VIVTVRSAVPTVRQVTSTIPIIFAVAIDLVGSGLVESLAKPGGNVTGLSLQAANLAGKRIELLREIVPQLRRWGMPRRYWKCARPRPQLSRSGLKSGQSNFGGRRISVLRSR
jgi:hypothetical protein